MNDSVQILSQSVRKKLSKLVSRHQSSLTEADFGHNEVRDLLAECYPVLTQPLGELDDATALQGLREMYSILKEHNAWSQSEEYMFKRGIRALETKYFKETERNSELLEDFSWNFSWES